MAINKGIVGIGDAGGSVVASDNFNPLLYNGNSTNDFGTSLAQSVTGVGFQPDLVWIKARTVSYTHGWFDSVRGATNYLSSNTTGSQASSAGFLKSFDSDGFGLGGDFAFNRNPNPYVAWNWKAGGAPTATNSAGAGNVPTSGSVMIDGVASTAALAGTIAATSISANTAAGFSIISYTGASGTVGHGLDSTPEIIIQKKTNGTEDWYVYFPPGVINSNYNYMVLNTSNTGIGTTGSTPPTTTTFNPVSNSGNYIAYAFHSIAGYSKIGTYTGTSVANHSIVTGFKPAWVMIKNTNSGYSWIITDDKRTTDKILYANLSQGEDTTSNGITSFDSNGFTLGTAVSFNQNTNVYIFMAFAE